MIGLRLRWPRLRSPIRHLLGRTAGAGRLPLAIAVCVIAGVCALIASMRDEPAGESRLTRVPTLNSAPGGQRQRDSAQYRRAVRSANLANADAAAADDQSFLSIPEALTDPLPRETPATEAGVVTMARASSIEADARQPLPVEAEDRQSASVMPDDVRPALDDVQPALTEAALSDPALVEPVPVRIATPESRAASDLRAEAMLRQMGVIAKALVPPRPAVETFDEAAPDPAPPSPVAAGDLAMGEIETPASSDIDRPVMARILSGRLAGARLVGGFARPPGAMGLTLSFDRMTMPGGERFAIDAIAIDGRDGSGAIAARTNRRLLARYAPTLSAAFVAGLGSHLAQPRERYRSDGDVTQITRERPRLRDGVAAGMAQAADAIAADLAAAAPRGAEILIAAGHPVAILFLDLATAAPAAER